MLLGHADHDAETISASLNGVAEEGHLDVDADQQGDEPQADNGFPETVTAGTSSSDTVNIDDSALEGAVDADVNQHQTHSHDTDLVDEDYAEIDWQEESVEELGTSETPTSAMKRARAEDDLGMEKEKGMQCNADCRTDPELISK